LKEVDHLFFLSKYIIDEIHQKNNYVKYRLFLFFFWNESLCDIRRK